MTDKNILSDNKDEVTPESKAGGTIADSADKISETMQMKRITLHLDTGVNKLRKEKLQEACEDGSINNPELDGAHLIIPEQQENERDFMQNLTGLNHAYKLTLANPDTKILVASFLNYDNVLEAIASKAGKSDILKILQANPNVVFIELPFTKEAINNVSFRTPTKNITNNELIDTMHELTTQHLRTIRHSLEPSKIKDPYHPEPGREQNYVDHAFELTQQYFPGLDTVEKMLDFVLHIKLNIPEPMKGQRIEGVYVDVDGTLIEYVPIGSEKEGKQQLRNEVVELLKKYEREGKEIYVWTGGDVEMKEKYLRSLGITWPVVSKYDYAGATAEIVIDDTDKGAFVLQSKILPETYIDTRNMN